MYSEVLRGSTIMEYGKGSFRGGGGKEGIKRLESVKKG
jgi:hypothetical protein